MEKQCPYCGNFIPAKAMKCRHCERWLDHIPDRAPSSVMQSPLVKTFLLFAGAMAIGAALYMGIRYIQNENSRPSQEQQAVAEVKTESNTIRDIAPVDEPTDEAETNESELQESIIEEDSYDNDSPTLTDSPEYHLPYYGTLEPGQTMARAALTSSFANTHRGMTADQFNSSGVVRSSDRVLMATTDDGYRYQYFFDSSVGSSGNYSPYAQLTGVAASKTCNGNEIYECHRFDSRLENEGCSMVYPNVFKTPQGNYVSAGYKGNRLWIYFYYPESPTRNECAPRSS